MSSHVVFHYLAVMKCISGCPEVILNAGLVVDMKFLLPGTPDFNAPGFFMCGYMKTKVYASTVNTREELRH
jgi:hypothetical protein